MALPSPLKKPLGSLRGRVFSLPPEAIPQDRETKDMLWRLNNEREVLESRGDRFGAYSKLNSVVAVYEANEVLRAKGIVVMEDEERKALEKSARELHQVVTKECEEADAALETAQENLDKVEGDPAADSLTRIRAKRALGDAQEKQKFASGYKKFADQYMEKHWGESTKDVLQSAPVKAEKVTAIPSLTPEQEKKFPAMKLTLERMSRAATSLRSEGKVEEAKTLELTMVELAGAKSYTRLDALYAMKGSLANQCYVEGRDSLGDTYMMAQDYALTANNNDFYEDNLKAAEEEGAEKIYRIRKIGALANERARRREEERNPEARERVLRTADGSEYSPREIVNGRRDNGEEIPEKHKSELYPAITREVGENSRVLLKAVAPGGKPPKYEIDPETMEPFADSPKPGTPVPGAPQFTYLGNGSEQNVYLHGETGMVYKVPHEKNLWMEAKRSSYGVMQRVSEEAYAEIDNEALRRNGVEHVTTMFTSASSGGTEFSMVVQPKIPRGEWQEIDLSSKAMDELKAMGVDDLHAGNVLVNSATGKVMLLDCLNLDRTSV